jgi:nicotinate-nucleotide pyrophosphorylase
MATGPSRHVLQRRLARVEALADRATTAGERQAAAAAANRLRARLATTRSTIPADPLLDPRGGRWPGRAVLRARVLDWIQGRQTHQAIARWAQQEVDRWLLPDVPVHDPVGVEVEVLLQLSTLHLGALLPERDGAALMAFLDTPLQLTESGWQAWYRHLRGEADSALQGHR